MKTLLLNLGRLAFSALLASTSLVGGCGGDTGSWQEEVKLADGRVIIVTQKRRYEGRVPREHWMRFKLPEFGSQEITWHEKLSPHVLNVYQGKLYVVGIPFTEQEFRFYGDPRPSYVGYRFDVGQWRRIPFGDIPVAIYDTNLLIANGPPNGANVVSLEIKETRMKDETLDGPLKKVDPKWNMLNY